MRFPEPDEEIGKHKTMALPSLFVWKSSFFIKISVRNLLFKIFLNFLFKILNMANIDVYNPH